MSADGRTHWEGCEREHHGCALARLAERTRERDEALRLARGDLTREEIECWMLTDTTVSGMAMALQVRMPELRTAFRALRTDLTAALAREAKLVQAIRVSGHGVAIPGTANVDWCGTTGCSACDAVAESVAALPEDAS